MSGAVKKVKKIWKKLDPIGYKFSASRALFDAMGQKGGPPSADDQTGRQRMQRSPNAPHEIVYGRTVKSGVCVLCEETGTDREYLHLVVALAPHQVKSIGTIYFNDKPSTDYPSQYFRVKKHLGSPTQTADSDLVSEISKWTNNHRLQGIAYVYVRFKYDKEGKVWTNGVPNIKCELEGKDDIWDPRDDSYGYSENAALCMLDYALSSRGGKLDVNKLPLSKWIAAANASDEVVSTPEGSEPRFTLNGIVKTSSSVAENFDALVTAMGGHWSMTLNGFTAIPGVYQGAPGVVIDDDDFMSDIKINPRSSRKDTFNVVRGQFIDPDSVYMPADFPEVRDQDLIDQFNEEIVEDIEFPYTISPYAAQRLSRLMLARNKTPMTANFDVSTKGMLVALGENVALTNSVLGWSSYGMRLIDFDFKPDSNDVTWVTREENASMYAYADGSLQQYTAPPRTSLPSAHDVPVPGAITVNNTYLTSPTGQIKVGVKCSWYEPNFAFLRDYEIQWSPAGQNQWTGLISPKNNLTIENQVENSTIDIRIRAIANWGSASDWVTVNNHLVETKSIPPGKPTQLSVIGGYRKNSLTWELPLDPDLKGTEIYVSGANNFSQALYLETVSAPTKSFLHELDPNITRYYWIRCIDTSGNVSNLYTSAGISGTTSGFDYNDFNGDIPLPNLPTGVQNDHLTYTQIRTPGGFGYFADVDYADWGTRVNNRPSHLTDSRIPNGLLPNGEIALPISQFRANESGLLRYTGGGLFTGDTDATYGAQWGVNVSDQPLDIELLNDYVLNDARVRDNMLKTEVLVPGDFDPEATSDAEPFHPYSTSDVNANNSCDLEVGHDGKTRPIYRAVCSTDQTVTGNWSGGWQHYLLGSEGFSKKKTYLFSCFVKMEDVSSGRRFYMGYGDYQVKVMGGASQNNPYSVVDAPPSSNKWYLLAVLIHGEDYSGSESGISGWYDPVTGKKVNDDVTEYAWNGSGADVFIRIAQYRCDVGDSVRFSDPIFTEVTNAKSLIERMGTATVGATDVESREFGRSDLPWRETFNTEASLEDWYFVNGNEANATWRDAASSTILKNGGGFITFGDDSGNDEAWCVHNQRLPYNPDLLYKITFILYVNAGSGNGFFGGVTGFDENGNPIRVTGDSSYSSSHYVAASNEVITSSDGLVKFVGWFKGHAASGNGGKHPSPQDPATLHENIRYFSPMFIANYNNEAGRTHLDAVIVEAFEPTTTHNVATTIVNPGQLVDGLSIDQGNGDFRRAPFGLSAFNGRDGDSITFATAFDTPPRVKLFGGLSYSNTLTGKHAQDVRAVNVSTSGFDIHAKLTELAGGVVARTDTSGSANVSGFDFVKHKSQSAQAWNDNYSFQIDVSVTNSYQSEIGAWIAGSVVVGFYTNDGSGWVKRGEKTYNGSNSGTSSTPRSNDVTTIQVDGLTNHAGHEFAVDVISTAFGGSITAFDNVKYQTATAPSSETATPTGVSDIYAELLAGE